LAVKPAAQGKGIVFPSCIRGFDSLRPLQCPCRTKVCAPVDRKPGRLGWRIRRTQFLDLHLVDAVDDLQISAGDRFDAPCRDQILGVGIRVIKYVIDDMEAGRPLEDMLQFAAWTPFRACIDRNAEGLERVERDPSERYG
jgi:hypothetical protein